MPPISYPVKSDKPSKNVLFKAHPLGQAGRKYSIASPNVKMRPSTRWRRALRRHSICDFYPIAALSKML
jgi:hypothetical protein